ncbi:MAG: phosphatidylglycerophosphatase A [Helcococcus sp.]|nr:phosphatidylglycerophosphatase A [Helcococcus sp.]
MGNLSKKNKFSIEELQELTIKALSDRGVEIQDIADIVYELQAPYISDLSIEFCLYSLNKVLGKREVIHAVLTGIEIDKLAEKDQLAEPILSIIKSDEGLYGIDEILPLSIVNLYGSIGLTNFGYLDKRKIGIIDKLDKEKNGKVNTFLDDIVAAIAAAAASRMAHSSKQPNLKYYE